MQGSTEVGSLLGAQHAAAKDRVAASRVIRGQERPFEDVNSSLAHGLRVKILVGPADGSLHMEVALSELAPGGTIKGHYHPFEEAFFVLSGGALLSLAGESYRLRRNDFGFAPIGMTHAWRNDGTEPAVWLRIRAPQPRPIGGINGSYPRDRLEPPSGGRKVAELEPSVRFVGHFSDEDMPIPGPLSMPGYHGHNVRGVSIRMMCDEILGAQHLTMFMVEFTPATADMPGAKEHFHPFEEMFYFVSGEGRASLAGEQHDVGPGDVLHLGVNASHGIRNTGTVPHRWIEVQAPKPPTSDAFFFEADWVEPSGDSQ